MEQKTVQNPLSLNNLDSLIEMLKIDKNYKQALKYGCNNYNINPYKINKLKLEEISQFANLIQLNYINHEKDSTYSRKQNKYSWLANQLKLFIWMAVCHSFLLKKPLENYEQEDWGFFTSILSNKNNKDLQFQVKSLFKNYHGNKQKWDEQQVQIIRQIIENQKYQNKWNDVSKLLYFRSAQKYYRSSQRCREYWYNHLDPKLNKNPWTTEEDLKLVKQLQVYGFKWSKITQNIESNWGYRRTQHMVKNRTKFICRKYGYKDEKEQGCQKELKMIERKLNQQRNRATQSSETIKLIDSTDQKPNALQCQIVQKPRQSIEYFPKMQDTYLKERNIQDDSQQQSSQSQQQYQQKPIKKYSKLPSYKPNSLQDKSNIKRNVIILFQAQTQVFKNVQSAMMQEQQEQESPQIIVQQNHDEQENMEENQHQKQESYFDEYNIIEKVPNEEQLNLNEQIQFNHDTHGGRMRQRVTHQLAQFFSCQKKQGQNP